MRWIGMGLAGLMMLPLAAAAHEIEALAISPDGSTLLIAADNRVLYQMNTADMTIAERHYYPELVEWVSYSADGATVFFRTEEGTFQAVSAESFEEKFSAKDVDAVSYAPEARRLALLDASFKGGVLTVLAATSGKQMSQLEIPELRVQNVALSQDGRRAILLTNSATSDTEEKEQPGADLKGYDKYLFRQQHDGYISQVVSADLRAGSFEAIDTFYRVSQPRYVGMLGDRAAIVNGVSDSALITATGETQMINMGENFVGHSRISNDGSQIITTTNRDLTVHPFENGAVGDATRTFKADDIGGPSERVTRLTEGADGTIYAATTAYRIWKIAPGSTEIEAAPVY